MQHSACARLQRPGCLGEKLPIRGAGATPRKVGEDLGDRFWCPVAQGPHRMAQTPRQANNRARARPARPPAAPSSVSKKGRRKWARPKQIAGRRRLLQPRPGCPAPSGPRPCTGHSRFTPWQAQGDARGRSRRVSAPCHRAWTPGFASEPVSQDFKAQRGSAWPSPVCWGSRAGSPLSASLGAPR